MNDILLLAKAFNFAAIAHTQHRRKGEAAEPYINHLAEVAELVATATGGNDTHLVVAALLHDTVEDTEVSQSDLQREFNEDIASLVMEVTDDKSLPMQKRKELQVKKASSKTDRAKILKLADKTSNIRALVKSPPAHWNAARRIEYLEWGVRVVEGLRGVNAHLEMQFDRAVSNTR